MTENLDICIYHHPCADGFTAAWAVWRKFPDILFHPGVYGEEPPDVMGLDVVLVDFSYKRPVLEKMLETARTVTILDHHKSAQADLDGLGMRYPNANILFDMSRSGAMMAWHYFHDERPPALVRYVQDRDLWRFDLVGSREVSAVLSSYDFDFHAWNSFAADVELDLQTVIDQGRALERKHHKDVRSALKASTRSMVIGGMTVPVANVGGGVASDAGNALAQDVPFGATYFDRADGKRVFSLRSTPDGLDVSEIAVRYGGGGHARAAGFTAPKGWEGDGA